MAFDPLQQRGIPLDEQPRNWRELNVTPIDPDHADPYTRCRIITMNGIEAEAIQFSHQLARHCPDLEIRQQLARVRYIEAQQQKVVGWLLPGSSSVLETTIAYEQTAVDLTAWAARMEPDPYLKQAYQFGLLEHFDHLYRYANLYETIEHRGADKIVGRLTEVTPGRPTYLQHRDPLDNVRQPYDRSVTEPLSRLHALTITAAEQQAMTFSMIMGPSFMEPAARQLYQEIGLVQEGHLTHYESLVDPTESWWERLLNHEYNECYLYYSFMETEPDPKVKAVWELHLDMELEHLRLAAELFKRFDGRDPDQVLAPALPPPVTFEPNKGYLRDLLATQIDCTTLGTGYVREAHERFTRMQETVMGGEKPASERVIDDNRAISGREYRLETEGPHPAGLQLSR
ncbi:ferritin-like domain-containing protein [Nonomuraea sp. MG754425]|uniref:ferritin-like domain-containing protein n=1 Tax=Nonomuraea sp. MG754425 TaxID=2570319 RepID=UPI001F2F65F4|nr:ferritin-like domain-containing protein [Nonomuraea sp. MG754425]MCF6476450.1 ferritin-like domain-containing protein [Nonomuraea sp. MG754425]